MAKISKRKHKNTTCHTYYVLGNPQRSDYHWYFFFNNLLFIKFSDASHLNKYNNRFAGKCETLL